MERTPPSSNAHMSSVSHTRDCLNAAKSASYLTFIFNTLLEREAVRTHARSAPRRPVSSQDNRGQSHTPFGTTKNPSLRGLPAHYSVAAGSRPENMLRNRYYQLEPYDRTRVVVGGGHESEGRYLNASWVLERFGHKWWIATQAALPTTAHAFLSLILQSTARPSPEWLNNADPSAELPPRGKIRTVVQLTQNMESGRRKAHAYFPSDIGRSLVIMPEEGCSASALKVTLLETRSFEDAHCIQSTVSIVPVNSPDSSHLARRAGSEEETSIENGNYGEEIVSQRVVFRHMLYTSWPDHGVPTKEDQASIISFARLVDEVNRDTSIVSPSEGTEVNPDPPIAVGCSAGIGRTGSFIAISSLLRFLGQLPPPSSPTPTSFLPASPLGPLPASLANDPIVQEVDSLREQRPGMVERDEQVLFVYDVMAVALGEM